MTSLIHAKKSTDPFTIWSNFQLWQFFKVAQSYPHGPKLAQLTVSLHVRMCCCTPRFCISQTARPIVFKFGAWVSSHYLSAFHKSWVGYLCTCARAHRASVSQERLDRLCSNLVCGLEVTTWSSTCFPQVMGGVGHLCARAHVHPHLRISGSEWPIVLKLNVWLQTQ